MSPARRKYSDEVKRRAVEMVFVRGLSVAAVSREVGVSASSLRQWVQARDAQDWADTVDVHFGFLAEHGFTLAEKDASWYWTWDVVYRCGPAAIVVTQDRQGPCVDVQLVRAAPVPLARRYLIKDGEVSGVAWAVKLIWLRAPDPDDLLWQIEGLGLTSDEIDTQLAFWADILRTYGGDFLSGDLRVLDEPDPVVKRRTQRKRRSA
jgi:Transposase